MKKRAIILFLLGFHFLLNGQTQVESKTTNNLPFENINLMTDRDLYLSGETIWFIADINLGNNQEALSQIIYIELFNADQMSIVRKKYRIKQGHAQGALDIPSEFLSDVYFLRAYYYFELVKFFGGVPLFTETRLSSSDSGSLKRATAIKANKREAPTRYAMP